MRRRLCKRLTIAIAVLVWAGLAPPLTITNAEMDVALDILDACLADEQAARG